MATNRYFPDGFHTGDIDARLTPLYPPEAASSMVFHFVGPVFGHVPHAKSFGNGSHRAPVSQIASLVSELTFVLLHHPGFSNGRVVRSRAMFRRIFWNSWRGIATSAS